MEPIKVDVVEFDPLWVLIVIMGLILVTRKGRSQ